AAVPPSAAQVCAPSGDSGARPEAVRPGLRGLRRWLLTGLGVRLPGGWPAGSPLLELWSRLRFRLRAGPALPAATAEAVRALVDEDWYLQAYPDVGHSDLAPADHFLRVGMAEGRRPNALFDSAWYMSRLAPPAQPGAGGPPGAAVLHYLASGWRAGARPGPTFDGADYLARYPDVAAAGIDPLTHFIRHGRREGRDGPARPLRPAAPAPAGAEPEAEARPGSDPVLRAFADQVQRRQELFVARDPGNAEVLRRPLGTGPVVFRPEPADSAAAQDAPGQNSLR
ncbi:MAG: hypothetical protein JWR86_1563, partial [Enterovirga sp.]|nr:hypothetical protein [Enterovirga sp.]